MLKIGINENVVLSSVKLSEKEGKYAIDFQFGGISEASDPFEEQLDADGYSKTSMDRPIKFWPPAVALTTKTNGEVRSPLEIAQDTLTSVKELKNLLQQFALCYTTSDKINLNDYLRNTGVTKENWVTNLASEAVLLQITRNLLEDFNRDVKNYLGVNSPETNLRLLLIRQKDYPGFRRYYIADNPVVESMIIQKEASKLKFTKKELEQGLDKESAPSIVPDVPAEAVDAVALFSAQS